MDALWNLTTSPTRPRACCAKSGEGGRIQARLEGDWTLLALRERVEALRGELGESADRQCVLGPERGAPARPDGRAAAVAGLGSPPAGGSALAARPDGGHVPGAVRTTGQQAGKPAKPPRAQNVRQFGQGLLNLASHLLDAYALLGQVTRDLGRWPATPT